VGRPVAQRIEHGRCSLASRPVAAPASRASAKPLRARLFASWRRAGEHHLLSAPPPTGTQLLAGPLTAAARAASPGRAGGWRVGEVSLQ